MLHTLAEHLPKLQAGAARKLRTDLWEGHWNLQKSSFPHLCTLQGRPCIQAGQMKAHLDAHPAATHIQVRVAYQIAPRAEISCNEIDKRDGVCTSALLSYSEYKYSTSVGSGTRVVGGAEIPVPFATPVS